MIRKISLLCAALALTASFAYAKDDTKKPVKVVGYVMDKMCAGDHVTEAKAKRHSTSCALMESCEKSGYTVVSGETAYKLDDNGNKLAAELLHHTQTKSGVKVAVEGTLDGDTIHTDKLTEVK